MRKIFPITLFLMFTFYNKTFAYRSSSVISSGYDDDNLKVILIIIGIVIALFLIKFIISNLFGKKTHDTGKLVITKLDIDGENLEIQGRKGGIINFIMTKLNLENKQTITFNQENFIFNSKELTGEKNIKVPNKKITSIGVSYGINSKILIICIIILFIPFFVKKAVLISIILFAVSLFFLYYSRTIKIELISDSGTNYIYKLGKSLIKDIKINPNQSNRIKEKLFTYIK